MEAGASGGTGATVGRAVRNTVVASVSTPLPHTGDSRVWAAEWIDLIARGESVLSPITIQLALPVPCPHFSPDTGVW